MPNKPDEEIRKSIKKYEESLPDSERNPNAQKDIEGAIERAAQPLPSKPEKPPRPDGYTDTQTHSHNTEDTSGSHSDTSHPKNA
jgi:hypothetical protein